MIKEIILLILLFILYTYLYFSIIISWFYKDLDMMKKNWYSNFAKYVVIVLKLLKIDDKIIFKTQIPENFNMIVMNHTSIFDNIILNYILEKNYKWHEIRTVSKISSKSLQNKMLKINGNMLINKKIDNINQKKTILQWKKYSKLAIILFPEGTVYRGNSKLTKRKEMCLKKIGLKEKDFDGTIIPNDGIFNYIISEMDEDLESIYDITAIYTLNNKRFYGREIDILFSIFKPSFKIYVNIEEYSLKNKIIKVNENIYKIKIGEYLSEELFKIINLVLDKKPKMIIFIQHNKTNFNLGLDLTNDNNKFLLDQYIQLTRRLIDFEGIIVSKINGKVRGGGMMFPAISDLCYCSSESTFGLPEINLGMIPSIVSTILKRKINNSILKYYSMTGEPISVDKAIEIGLVSRIYQIDTWDNTYRRFVKNVDNAILIKKYSKLNTPESMGVVMGKFMSNNDQIVVTKYKNIKFSIKNDIGILTLYDNKSVNIFSHQTASEIETLSKKIPKNIRVIILKSGLTHFHVGINPYMINKYSKLSKIEIANKIKDSYHGLLSLFKLDIPIITILNGKVFGGGLPLALWSDYRIVTKDIDFHFGNITRGMSPAGQLSTLLKDFLNRNDLMELYFHNSHWNSDDCVKKGICNIVCDNMKEATKEALKLAKFISKCNPNGVSNNLKLLRIKHIEEIVNEEVWYIANSISNNNTFTNIKDQNKSLLLKKKSNSNIKYGIVSMKLYTPNYYIDSVELENNNITCDKYMHKKIAVWDTNEDSVSMALNAVNRLIKDNNIDSKMIGRLEVGTESSVDLAKSIKSYLMDLFDNKEMEGVDNINACYGGVAALLNSLNWLKCQNSNKYAIVVITDTAIMDIDRLGFQGAGACAILLGKNPAIEINDHIISCMKNTSDFQKPLHSEKLGPSIKGMESLTTYQDSLKYCLEKFLIETNKKITDFDYIVIHGGLCKNFVINTFKQISTWYQIDYKILEKKFIKSTIHGENIGGLYTASLFFSLHSLLEYETNITEKNILMFGYGSGSCSSIFSLSINNLPENFDALKPTLDRRIELNFEQVIINNTRHLEMKNNNFSYELKKKNNTYYLKKYNPLNNERTYELF